MRLASFDSKRIAPNALALPCEQFNMNEAINYKLRAK